MRSPRRCSAPPNTGPSSRPRALPICKRPETGRGGLCTGTTTSTGIAASVTSRRLSAMPAGMGPCSPEVLRDGEDAHMIAPAKKVLIRQDEMAEFFANLDRYTTGRGGGDRGPYLRLFNGGPYNVARITRGSFCVPNWSACLLGGIQPEPIQRIAQNAADDGLLQRPIYAVPGAQQQGRDRTPDGPALARYRALFPVLT